MINLFDFFEIFFYHMKNCAPFQKCLHLVICCYFVRLFLNFENFNNLADLKLFTLKKDKYFINSDYEYFEQRFNTDQIYS